MRAFLVTLDGMQGETEVGAPPPKVLEMPLRVSTNVRGADGKPWTPVRTYRLVHCRMTGARLSAYYQEVL